MFAITNISSDDPSRQEAAGALPRGSRHHHQTAALLTGRSLLSVRPTLRHVSPN